MTSSFAQTGNGPKAAMALSVVRVPPNCQKCGRFMHLSEQRDRWWCIHSTTEAYWRWVVFNH